MTYQTQAELAYRAAQAFARSLPRLLAEIREFDPGASFDVTEDSISLEVSPEHARRAQRLLSVYMERSLAKVQKENLADE